MLSKNRYPIIATFVLYAGFSLSQWFAQFAGPQISVKLHARNHAKSASAEYLKRKPMVVATTIAAALQNKTLQSREGRPLELITVTTHSTTKELSAATVAPSQAPYRFLVQGGMHGNEKLTPQFVLWLASRTARGESALNQLPYTHYQIDFVPAVNPDGVAKATRANAAGVNLNRNFGVLWGVSRENPGTAAFSEPETAAIKALFAARSYAASVDVHGYINWIVSPSRPTEIQQERQVTAEDNARFDAWTKTLYQIAQFMTQIGQGIANKKAYEVYSAGELGDGGAFEDWAFWSQKTPAFCLEMHHAERYIAANNPLAKGLGPSLIAPAALTSESQIDTFLAYEHTIFMAFSSLASRPTDQTAARSILERARKSH